MSNESGDGIDDALDGAARVGATMAWRDVEIRARKRARLAQEAQEQRRRGAETLYRQMLAEQEAARALYGRARRDDWWSRADGHDIARVWSEVNEWRGVDPQAEEFRSYFSDELKRRHGLDVDGLDMYDGQLVEEELTAARKKRSERVEATHVSAAADVMDSEAAQDARTESRTRNRDDEEEPSEAAAWARAERDYRAETRDAGAWEDATPQEQGAYLAVALSQLRNERAATRAAGYDTVERRDAFAVSLRGVVSPVVIESRIRADMAQGSPAPAAPASSASRSRPKARRVRGHAVAHERSR